MAPSETSLLEADVTVDDDVMKCGFRLRTKWTLGRGSVAPKLQHGGRFHRIYLRVQHKRDDPGAGTVDEVSPGQIEGTNVIPVSPGALLNETCSMSHQLFFLEPTQNIGCLRTNLIDAWVREVEAFLRTEAGVVGLTSETQTVINHRFELGEGLRTRPAVCKVAHTLLFTAEDILGSWEEDSKQQRTICMCW